jgi:tRNA nucleotidyltransferase (CCA-adding enzyme)
MGAIKVTFKEFTESILESRIPMDINLPKDIKDISEIFKKKGKGLYLVGGAVRDAVMGKKPKDFDVATDATPDEVIEMLNDKYKVMEVGKSFGVVVAITPEFPDGIEIATFREDVGTGRRPEGVRFTDISTDVKRRDLTINALFYDIEKKEVVDLVGGLSDIESGIIRTVGDPDKRFEEDPLRKLRVVRFAARMGNEIDSETKKSLIRNNDISGVSRERIRDEFMKILSSAKSVDQALGFLCDLEFMPQIFPELEVNPDNSDSSIPLCCIALLLRDNDPVELPKKLNKLTYTIDEVNFISFLVSFQKLSINTAYELKKRQYKVRNTVPAIQEFSDNAEMDQRLVKAFIHYDTSVKGQDLLDLGLSGKELGEEMNKRETEIFSNILNNI